MEGERLFSSGGREAIIQWSERERLLSSEGRGRLISSGGRQRLLSSGRREQGLIRAGGGGGVDRVASHSPLPITLALLANLIHHKDLI